MQAMPSSLLGPLLNSGPYSPSEYPGIPTNWHASSSARTYTTASTGLGFHHWVQAYITRLKADPPAAPMKHRLSIKRQVCRPGVRVQFDLLQARRVSRPSKPVEDTRNLETHALTRVPYVPVARRHLKQRETLYLCTVVLQMQMPSFYIPRPASAAVPPEPP